MADYIEREAAIAAIMDVYVSAAGYKTRERMLKAKEAVSELPAADAMPVRHGFWRNHYRSGVTVSGKFVSSCCDMWVAQKSPYCPHCGARMWA